MTPIRAVRRDPDVPEDTPGRGDVQHLAHEARKHVGRQDEEKGEGERGNGQDDERCRRLEQGCAQKDEPARGGEDPVGRSKSPACGHFKIPHLTRRSGRAKGAAENWLGEVPQILHHRW